MTAKPSDKGSPVLEKVTDLCVVRSERKEPCHYCGGDAHSVPLACPRIMAVEIDTEVGAICGITFWGDFFKETPPDAA